MDLLYKILISFQIFLSLGLLLFIIVQKTSSDGLFVSSATSSFASKNQVDDFINKSIKVMVILFFINCFSIAIINSRLSKNNIIGEIKKEQANKTTENTRPENIDVPV